MTLKSSMKKPMERGASRHTLLRGLKVLCLGLLLSFKVSGQAIFREDFEELSLGPNVEETLTGAHVWTKTPPAGWTTDDSKMPGVSDPARNGITEWAGWSFANKDWACCGLKAAAVPAWNGSLLIPMAAAPWLVAHNRERSKRTASAPSQNLPSPLCRCVRRSQMTIEPSQLLDVNLEPATKVSALAVSE